jgi:diguanylate cyclase (GGDEF)-like protein
MDTDARLYRALLASTSAMLFLDSIAWLFDGKTGSLGRDAVFIASALYYVVHTIPIAFFILYSDYQIFRDERRFPKLAVPLLIIEVLVSIAAFLSLFTGSLFSVDEGNHYFRGPLFPVFAVVQYGLVAFILGHVVRNGKMVNRRVFISLLAYPLPMLAAAVLQMAFYGLILIWPTMTLFLVVAAFNIENRRAKTDYLTGTANRRSLDEELERRIEFSRQGRTLCGLMLDIDDFKGINDRFGHEAGDRALEDVANILLSSVRVNDHVARMGGDEFVILFDTPGPISTEELVHRIESAIENLNASGRRSYSLSLSIGRALYDQDRGGAASDFLSILDSDMYARKKSRKPIG